MRTIRLLFMRTIARMFTSPSSAFCIAGFLALAGGFFVRALFRGDGGTLPIEALWASAAVPFLPVLSTLATMRLIADSRTSGMIDTLLSAPILEREIVLGKYLAALVMCGIAVLLYLSVPLVFLPYFAPSVNCTLNVLPFLPATFAMMMQCALWCGIGLLASAGFKNAAVAALASLVLMLAIPHMTFEAAVAWSPTLRMKFASMPFEAHIIDLSTGLFRLSTIIFYVTLTGFSIFATTKIIAGLRMRGRTKRGLRFSTYFVVFSGFVFACLLATLAFRLDFTFELPLRARSAQVSARTRQILGETRGDISVTCFLARNAPEFRVVSRLLRGLEATARSVAGTQMDVEYVDPRWELGRAIDLVRVGAEEGTIIFRRGNRRIPVRVSELFSGATNNVLSVGALGVFVGETVCASALQRLDLPASREVVYWTTGHGEITFNTYDSVKGMSDIARELRRDGYKLAELDVASAPAVPGDCAAIIVSGAREPFSRTEMSRIEGWMRAGGRMLVLSTSEPNAGVSSLVSKLGVNVLPYAVVSKKTLSGSDVVVRNLADHPVTRPLIGGTAVFSRAAPLTQSAAAKAGGTVYTELALTDENAWGESDVSVRPWIRDGATEPGGPLALVASIERGGDIAKDVMIHPMRLVVIGDAGFVSNGALSDRGNANRDVFMNSIAWLSGLDALTASRSPGNTVDTGMDRDDWLRFAVVAVPVFSLAVLVFGLIISYFRRRDA